MATDKKTKVNRLLELFGLSQDKAGRQAIGGTKGKSLRDIYRALKEKTGLNKGTGFQEFAANKDPELFKKATRSYNLRTGSYSPTQLQDIVDKSKQDASTYYAPDIQRTDKNYGVNVGQYQQDLQQNLADNQTSYDRASADAATADAYNQTNYDRNLAALQQNQQIQNENLMTNLNQAGLYDSGRQVLAQQQLADSQNRDLSSPNDARAYQQQQLATSQSRNAEDLARSKKMFNRQYNRAKYNLDDIYNQNKLNLDRQQQSYANQLTNDQIDQLSTDSQNEYNAQNYGDQNAADFIDKTNQYLTA